MSNTLKTNILGERASLRTVVALSLALSLAAFGCSFNQTPGNGEPIYVSPAGGSTAPASTVTPGTSSGSSVPTTMVSGGVDRSVDAEAILRANEGYRGVILGPLNPAPLAPSAVSQQMNGQIMSGQFISPSVFANPQQTVNTSISSDAIPGAIVSGAEGGLLGATVGLPGVEGATVGAATVGATVAGAPAIAATAPLTNARNVAATPLLTTIGVGPVAITSAARASGTINTDTLTASPRVGSSITTGTVSAPIRIQRNALGAVVVSNVSSGLTNAPTVPARVRAVTRSNP
jgi:hypothetical protein